MSDPTGTSSLRRSFQAEGNRRLAQLRSQTFAVLVGADMMAARSDPLAQVAPDPGHRLAEFTGWFQRTAETLLWREPWWGRFLERAFDSGAEAGHGLVKASRHGPMPVPAMYRELAQREFAGIAAGLVQQVARQTAVAAVGGLKPALMYRTILATLRKSGQAWIKTAVNSLTVKAHNAARLEAFRAAGIKQVGVFPERLEPVRSSRGRLRDHAHAGECDHHHFLQDDRRTLAAALLRARRLFERQRAETEAEAVRAQVELAKELAEFERSVARMLSGEEPPTPNRIAAQAELERVQAEARASVEAIKRATAAREVEASAAWERVKTARAEERRRVYPQVRPEERGPPIRSTRVPPPGYERVAKIEVGVPTIPERLRAYGAEYLNVQTAGDDRVCIVCEEISEEGPYTLAEAQGLIPAHPNCRCTFVPAFDLRYVINRALGLPEEIEPDE